QACRQHVRADPEPSRSWSAHRVAPPSVAASPRLLSHPTFRFTAASSSRRAVGPPWTIRLGRRTSSVRMSRASVGAILSLTILGAATPGALARPVRHLTHLPGVVDYWPRLSPDGRTALFSRCAIPTGCGGASTSGYWTLWTVAIRHGKPTQFLVLANTG